MRTTTIMRQAVAGLTVALGATLAMAASTAQALPITWTIDSSASSLTVSLPAFGATSNAASVGGTISGDVDATSISASSGAIDVLDDLNLTVIGNPVTGSGLGGTLSGASTPIAGGVADLSGWALTLDEGTLVSAGLGLDLDLSVSPFAFVLPTTLSTVADLGGGVLEWLIPLNATTQVTVLGVMADVTVSGTILATGTPVPEPGTATLMLLGLAGLAARRRAS
jgi:hypothetical protein